jgi:hypothetical protein
VFGGRLRYLKYFNTSKSAKNRISPPHTKLKAIMVCEPLSVIIKKLKILCNAMARISPMVTAKMRTDKLFL